MAETPTPDDSADDVLQRADALLQRHRRPAAADAPSADGDIPTLTDIVIEGEVLPRAEASMPQDPADASQPAGGAVMSRVQAQNIEHAVHLKLKRSLNDQIAKVMEERYLPEIGAALEQAMMRASGALQSGIADLVRNSVAEALQTQLKQLQLQAPAPAAAGASGIIPCCQTL